MRTIRAFRDSMLCLNGRERPIYFRYCCFIVFLGVCSKSKIRPRSRLSSLQHSGLLWRPSVKRAADEVLWDSVAHLPVTLSSLVSIGSLDALPTYRYVASTPEKEYRRAPPGSLTKVAYDMKFERQHPFKHSRCAPFLAILNK